MPEIANAPNPAAFEGRHWERRSAITGYSFTLADIKKIYTELDAVSKTEGEHIIAALTKPDDRSDDDWQQYIDNVRARAFRLTVTIVGEGEARAFGDKSDIFDDKNLPMPIKTIFFTNVNAFKWEANGNSPPNEFSLLIDFSKPPLFDTNPLISDPTRNPSNVEITARDIWYFRAVSAIVNDEIRHNKLWYHVIHEKFSYDIGLWILAIPYSLLMVHKLMNYLSTRLAAYSDLEIPLYIYSLVLSLMIYRLLFMYLKWAFPVNVLGDNNDRSTRHRVTIISIVGGLIVAFIKSNLSSLWP
jgi:hypothetical protein